MSAMGSEGNIFINSIQFYDYQISDRANILKMIRNTLEMTHCLKRIAQFYFNEAQMNSRNISMLIEIDFQFITGCDSIIEILNAVKNKLLNNSCFCLVNDNFCK